MCRAPRSTRSSRTNTRCFHTWLRAIWRNWRRRCVKRRLKSADTLHDWVDAAVAATARYYNAHPAASVLLLRGAFTEPEQEAHAAKNLTIGEMFRAKVRELPELDALPSDPDVVLIAIELAFACMKYGYAREGIVSPAICREATRAVTSYLGQWRAAP